ncbi:reverse transcriptase domain, reverse transcriptase zinc-binding domain protein [Tanacetum coccineum]|uniref:Reverse transcriptase domain, reverse transcriptase zinc-binding domain protein n=1 Tax=Tanacetum coccineum TaxID=301880 RepID=A0ABQ5EXP9_9ASTR
MSPYVSINQSAFVPGLRISDNILLTQELMRNYHRRRGPHRCAFKVDIQKADDTVDWKFVETILVGFGFYPKMVQWIMVCVSGASYSISVNGNVHGWFKGKRGLRQGDPLSPYLFTLLMEILTLLLQRKVQNSDEFQYHHLCEQQRIINLCFADDLFLFARGHPSSVSVIMDALEEFKQVSGLVPSIPKSTLMRGFLWCQGDMKKGKAKVAWDFVCMPKHEGGLGIYRIEDFNIALMATHIWSIFTHRESLWVKWVHTYKLKSRSFWDVPCRDDARWPLDWLSQFPFLAQLHVPVLLDDRDDVILWRDRDGVLRPFSVACVWDTIRSREDMKLKTQDRLRQWDVGPSIDLNLLKCPLCDLVPDSHDHLFFECSFSSQVWSKVRVLMDAIPPHLSDVVAFIVLLSKGKTVVSIISRIVVVATSYYIWLERNGRLFKKKTSTPSQIVDVIFSTVRLKLVTFKFKKMSTKSRLLIDQWKIPSYCIIYDGSTR